MESKSPEELEIIISTRTSVVLAFSGLTVLAYYSIVNYFTDRPYIVYFIPIMMIIIIYLYMVTAFYHSLLIIKTRYKSKQKQIMLTNPIRVLTIAFCLMLVWSSFHVTVGIAQYQQILPITLGVSGLSVAAVLVYVAVVKL